MQIIKILGLGYLFGCLSPAAILGKRRQVDLKQEGTQNLGATNTTLVLGPKSGLIVLLVDIAKSMLSAKTACVFFPDMLYAGMIACIGCILGHCFPVFMQFEGGKGVAVFAGMVLMYNPWFALPIIVLGLLLIVLLNTGVAAPMVASFLFPVLVSMQRGDKIEILLSTTASVILIFMHRDNLRKAIHKEDDFFPRDFFARLMSRDDS